VKKRSIKITGKFLGRITQADGFVESEKARLRRQQIQIDRVQVKEYGIAAAIEHLFPDTISALKEFFPDCWQRLVALAYGRLIYQSPLKNMSFHYSHSYLSEQHSGVDLSARSLSYFLRELGQDRNRIVEFCRSFNISEDCILFDGTDIFSGSRQMELPKFSKSKMGTFDDMINLMCVFSVKRQAPVYYRLLPGNIKDVSAFKMSLQESGVKDATIIIDKGFASMSNIEALEKEDLKFIIPLPRNSSLIDYEKIKSGDKSLFDGYFQYEGRFIWYYTMTVDGYRAKRCTEPVEVSKYEKKSVTVFLDEELRYREEKDYLNRIESKTINYSIEKYHQKRHTFGTIAIIENTGKSSREVYVNYKTRGEVETMIDTLKNIVDADRTYMQNQQALEGWMFVNMIALKWYYLILNLLKKHELNKKYAPTDFLLFLSEVKMVKINNTWHRAEATRKTIELMQKIGMEPIT
jgi:transposase